MMPLASKTQRALAFMADAAIALSFLSLHRFWGTLLYFLYMLFRDHLPGMQHQSIGKKLLHIRVEDSYGSPATLKDHIIRNIPLVIPFFHLVELFLIFGNEQKRLGDVLAGTIVIRSPRHANNII